jgi:hypothetical protein
MDDELERTRREQVAIYFKELVRHSHGETGKTHENPQSEWPVSGQTRTGKPLNKKKKC